MTTAKALRAAIYARTSTAAQHADNQLGELRTFVQARGWSLAGEFVDIASGATASRPQLNQLLTDARRRRVDVICVWALDRWGRSLPHLVTTLDELQQLGVGFVSLRDGLDLSTAAGLAPDRRSLRARGIRARPTAGPCDVRLAASAGGRETTRTATVPDRGRPACQR
jgi:DNA invertase Pin-like site-specific DNA recombinase